MSSKKKARHYRRRIKRILKQVWVNPAYLQEIRRAFTTPKEEFEYLEDLLASAQVEAFEALHNEPIH